MTPNRFADPPKRLAYPPKEAFVAIGCGKTKGYELIAEGKLDARRLGGRTRITAQSIEAYLASLPPAPIQRRPAVSEAA
jgi:excisionase family DNA binding protein